VSDLAGL